MKLRNQEIVLTEHLSLLAVSTFSVLTIFMGVSNFSGLTSFMGGKPPANDPSILIPSTDINLQNPFDNNKPERKGHVQLKTPGDDETEKKRTPPPTRPPREPIEGRRDINP